MFSKINLLIILFNVFVSYAVKAYDFDDFNELGYHLELCNACDSLGQYKQTALNASPGDADVVVVNLKSQKVKAFKVFKEYDPERGWLSDVS